MFDFKPKSQQNCVNFDANNVKFIRKRNLVPPQRLRVAGVSCGLVCAGIITFLLPFCWPWQVYWATAKQKTKPQPMIKTLSYGLAS